VTDLGKVLISAHALDRFIERTGTTKGRAAVEARLRRRLECAQPMGGQHWYHEGWVFCIKDDVLTTVFRPRQRWCLRKVHRFAQRRAQFPKEATQPDQESSQCLPK